MSAVLERSTPSVPIHRTASALRDAPPAHLDARITRILDGEEAPPQAVDDALDLLRVRFGCIFKALPEQLRRDPSLIREAAIRSSGHELPYVPEDARSQVFTPRFIADLIDHDVPGWLAHVDGDANASARAIPCEVRLSPAVQSAVCRYDARIAQRLSELLAQCPVRLKS